MVYLQYTRLMTYKPGQKVEIKILRETPLGFVASINGVDEGLLYHNEIFERLRIGQELPAFINRIREKGQIDLLLHQFGNFGSAELGEQILEQLERQNGFLAVNSQTPAEQIYNLFGVSKKKFKMALGGLYKKRLVRITDDGIELAEIGSKSDK